ncbi:MAG TPA: zinc ABC transporter substrate-binding protein [Acidimicrobiales bacterium]|nr:zinc ABC transporter substrate-binding protein [Acidimicrobiales bacterium]
MRHRHSRSVKPRPLRRRAVGATVVVALALAVLTACASSGDDTAQSSVPSIVASTNVYGDIATQVAGDHAEVTSIIDRANADPHDYEATTRNILAVSRADIMIVNGGGYDDFMQTLRDGADNDAATVLDVVGISGHHGGDGGELNEHVWYDFPTVIGLTDRLRDALVGIDPVNAADYRANAGRLTDKIMDLEKTAEKIGAAHPGATVAVTEPVPLYLLDAIGLKNRTPDAFSEAVEEGEEASPAVLADTLALFADDAVDLLVESAQTVSEQTDQVAAAARRHGVPIVSVTETLPAHQSYVTWMAANLEAIAEALDEHPSGSDS